MIHETYNICILWVCTYTYTSNEKTCSNGYGTKHKVYVDAVVVFYLVLFNKYLETFFVCFFVFLNNSSASFFIFSCSEFKCLQIIYFYYINTSRFLKKGVRSRWCVGEWGREINNELHFSSILFCVLTV